MDGRVISSATQTSEGDSKMKRTCFRLLGAFVGFAAFLFGPFPALAQVAVAPNLNSAAPYAVLGTNSIPIIGTVTCTNTLGLGIGINGQVGTTFGAITNTGCTITGPIDTPVGGAVVTDFNAAFASVDGLNPLCTGVIPTVTSTLAPGVYCSAAGTTIGAGVTLTLSGTASDIWVFRVGTGGPGALTLTSAQVVMGGAAQACNVYWKTSAGMTVTDSASFVGTVLSGAAATMTRTTWIGRVMATTNVTLTNPEPMTFAGCAFVCPVITVNPATLPNGTLGIAYSQTVSGSGGTAPYTFAVTSGALPTGLSLNTTTGVIAGTPTTVGNFNFTITATDANGCPGTRAYAIVIAAAACPVITVNPAPPLPNGVVGTPYNQTVSAIGGLAPYTFSVTAGALPNGLLLNAGTGAITGTPTTVGNFNFTITATDANGCPGTRAYAIVIAAAACPVITVNPAPPLPNPVIGIVYSQQITASGGVGPYTYAVTSGALPNGLVLNGATGAITGTPTTAAAFNFTITATDTSSGCQGIRAYAVTAACPAITVNPAPPLPNPVIGIVYSQQITASGGVGPYTYAVTSGALPNGLVLNGATGAITGTPTTAAAFNFTITATDTSSGCQGIRAYAVTAACPVITVGPASLPSATVGATYGPVAMTATGGTAPYSFVVTSGTLPPGFTLSTAGVLSGVLTSAGSFSFTVTVTDAAGCQGVQGYTLGGGFSAVGGPTLDSLGLTILVLLLAVAGAFMVNRLSL
jgi:large repetitive protein